METESELSIFKSNAHRKLREKANGIDLSQFSMLTAKQYTHLLEMLALKKNERVLDLGCGVGRIAFSIQEATAAKLTGVELKPEFIKEASQAFGDKIELIEGDFDNLKWDKPTFDAIYSVDTFYFTKDLSKLIPRIYSILNPGGRLVIFWNQVLNDKNDISRLKPQATDLAILLKKNGIPFIFQEFLAEEIDLWKKYKAALIELKDEFIKEGEKEFFDAIEKETEWHHGRIAAKRISRHCYTIVKPSE